VHAAREGRATHHRPRVRREALAQRGLPRAAPHGLRLPRPASTPREPRRRRAGEVQGIRPPFCSDVEEARPPARQEGPRVLHGRGTLRPAGHADEGVGQEGFAADRGEADEVPVGVSLRGGRADDRREHGAHRAAREHADDERLPEDGVGRSRRVQGGLSSLGNSTNSVGTFPFSNTTDFFSGGQPIELLSSNNDGQGYSFASITVSRIPAPGSVALFGLAGLAAARRRRA